MSGVGYAVMPEPEEHQRKSWISAAAVGLVYALLFVVAVPWYWQFFPARAESILLGMPTWVTIAIAASFVVSALTAWRMLTCRWPGEEDAAVVRTDRNASAEVDS